jgi:membrane protein implicated in regulation of membrane protease activity
VAVAVLNFAVPDVVAAGAYVSDRMALLAFICIAIWVGASAAAPAIAVRRVSFALAAIAVAALVLRYDKQRELGSYIEEFVAAASLVGAHRVLLPIAVEPFGPRDENGRRLGYRVKPFLHATGWVIASNGGVDLKNSQAHTDQCPVRFRDSDPLLWLAGSVGMMEDAPPCVNLYVVSALKPDFLLVWGRRSDEALATPCGAAISAGLEQGFVEVYRSSPRGKLEIWKPKARATTASR